MPFCSLHLHAASLAWFTCFSLHSTSFPRPSPGNVSKKRCAPNFLHEWPRNILRCIFNSNIRSRRENRLLLFRMPSVCFLSLDAPRSRSNDRTNSSKAGYREQWRVALLVMVKFLGCPEWIEYVGYHRQLGFAPKGRQNSELGFAFFSSFLYWSSSSKCTSVH